jgi:hypothetical protein
MATRRRWWSFGVGTLLFLMACVAGYLSGFRLGADEKRTQARKQAFYSAVYDVGDLVSLDPNATVGASDFDELIELIISTVASETWVENGGPEAEIRPFPTNKSLVVSNTGAVHEQIADLLAQLRRTAYELDPEHVMSAVRESSARKLATPRIVKLYQTMNPHVHRIVEGHFDSGLELLTKRLGKPTSNFSLEDISFPTWIAAQRVAVWKQGDGKLYWALQDVLPEGEAVVVGWYEEGMDQIRPVGIAPAVADATRVK